MMDEYYTPPGLAALLVGAARGRRAKLIADFAMGDGALLRAAASRWPRAKLFGSDINHAALESAGDLAPQIEFKTFDFLSDGASKSSLEELEGRCDVILLNPPFTCRGNRRYPVVVDQQAYLGSKALAFVARALRYLKPGGELLAILPASCATSERDALLFQALQTRYAVNQVGEIRRKAFAGCSVGVILLRVRGRSLLTRAPAVARSVPLVAVKPYSALIMRGCTPMHRTTDVPGGLPVVHSADLRGGACNPQRWISVASRVAEGSVVLLPRVGRPDISKAILAELAPTCLSDCVIAIRSDPLGREAELLRLIRSNWNDLENVYGGSCAPYLTMARLKAFLMTLGVTSHLTNDMRLPQSEDRGMAAIGNAAARY